MSSPSVSVAMATFNGEAYLSEQLASLVAQRRPADEVVVCDDGSEDATLEILERFSVTAPFELKVVANEKRLGVLRNFEKALSLCTGDVVFLSDQDDVWLPGKIQRVLDEFVSKPRALVVINDKHIVEEDLARTGATMLGNIRGYGSPDTCFVAGCCSAFRRDWLSIALPIPEATPAHDSWLVGLAHRLGVVAILEEPLQLYRRHCSNVSKNTYSEGRSVSAGDRIAAELRSLRSEDRDDTDQYWNYFIGWHRAEADRITARRTQLDELGLAATSDLALRELTDLVAAEESRQRLSHMPRAQRLAPVWRLWQSGGYDLFSGWKSALKDLVQ